MLSQPSAFDPGQPKAGQFWIYFFPALTGMVGFWATLSLNIPDFSRYAKSQRDQVIGQTLGLSHPMGEGGVGFSPVEAEKEFAFFAVSHFELSRPEFFVSLWRNAAE